MSSVQKAVVAEEKGKAVFSESASIPTPGDNQVLLKVAAASLNPVDWKILAYNFFGLSFPFHLGTDVSGVVTAVGKDVKDFKVGDEVFATINLRRTGSFAEYALADASRLAHKGSKLTHQQAAAIPVAFLSALDGFQRIKVEAKQSIYVPGGAGGVGHFIVQLAKIYGLTVFSSGGKDDSLELLKTLKVDHVLNYSKDNIPEAISKLTDGKGVDWVYDATYSPSSIEVSAKVIKSGGTVVLLGYNTPKEGTEAAKILAEKKGNWIEADIGRYSAPGADEKKLVAGLDEAVKYFEEGKLAPHINQVIGLGEVIGALEAAQKGKTVPGKIVVDISKK